MFAKEFPHAKSLIVTGSMAETAELDLTGVAECLGKPLVIEYFIEAVAKALVKPPRITCAALEA